jgi:hypothetical protein
MACEKCWGDAYLRMLSEPSKPQADHYRDLLKEREGNPCTPEEQVAAPQPEKAEATHGKAAR